MRATLDFLLHDWLRVESLTARARFADHSRETFAAVLDTCERIAREKFAPANRTADLEEPRFDGEKVILPASTHAASRAYVESGMLAAAQDAALGGMQLPCVVEMAANSFFAKAGVGLGGHMLTSGNANLLMAHGTPTQQRVFAHQEFAGRFFGTMCLSEPQAGSSLSDIATRAEPDGEGADGDPLGPRYRLRGHKMWISNGDHELAENIVHLVLAKIPGPDGRLVPGVRGISLFIVPKWLVDEEGALTGERNDVALAGLNHKLGYRGIPNTLLNFGEGRYPVRGAAGAIGYRVGAPGEGLKGMFHMMNEARIAVGLGAVMLGAAGYEASLDYARQRPQGRPVSAGGYEARSVRPARTPASRRCRSSATPTCAACCWPRRAMSRAAWPWRCTAPAWSTSSTPASRTPPGMPHCCWRCSRPSPRAGRASGAWRPTAWRSRCTAATATPATIPSSSTGATTA
jgi:butyryl-CoA dehydrogenase